MHINANCKAFENLAADIFTNCIRVLFAEWAYIFNYHTVWDFVFPFSVKCYFLQYRLFMEITRISHGAEAILWLANNCPPGRWCTTRGLQFYHVPSKRIPQQRARSGYRRMFIGTFASLELVKFCAWDKCELNLNLRCFITCRMCNKIYEIF